MKIYFTFFCLMLFSFSIFISSILADIINVPADQSTIQAGINTATNGDTVLVADGLYLENISFNGKDITVASHFLTNGDTAHISNTIIDGSQPSNLDSGSVVYFTSGEDTTSILCGFTVTGGTGTLYPNNNRTGGGINILEASACIRNNIIEFNTITHATDGFGAGIFAEFLTNSDLIIKDNIIRNNNIISANSVNWSLGAGIKTYADGSETVYITGNRILNNTISAKVAYGCGILPANAGNATFIIKNNIISGNVINASSGASGGIDVYNHLPVIQNNVITNNSAPRGGGIGIEFKTNKSISGKRGTGINVYETYYNSKTFNFVVENFSNNTVVGNSATTSGGGIAVIGDIIPTFMNFIIWGNTAPSGAQISGSAIVEYSDVEGSFSGTDNIDSDPLFEDTLFHLLPGSPCIDAGNPDSVYNDPDGSRNDMGAYGGPGIIVQGLFNDSYNNNIPKDFYLSQNYPNPFNPRTNIEFSIPKAEFVSLKIFNILGQGVAILVSEKLTPGNYKYIWDASGLASGVYFYRLETENEFVQSKKLILLK